MNTTLDSVCSFLNGGTPSRSVPQYFDGDIPWITGADIVGPVVDKARAFITKEAIRDSATNHVPAGTILLVTRTSVGKVAVAGTDLCFSQDITAITPDPKKLDTGYLVQFLRTKQTHLQRLARGATIKGVTRAAVADIPVSLPSLSEQRKIAKMLDQAEALRSKRRAALAQLDTLTQSIFLDMFGDPASPTQRFPIQPLEALLGQSLQNGAYFPKESYTDVGGVEMVHMSDAFNEVVPRGKLKRVVCAISDVEKYALSENDILIARRSLTLEGAAKPCLIPKSSEPLIFESSFIRITPQPNKLTALYLYHYLGNERVKQKCVQPYITQSTISGINQSNLERVSVIVPPLSLQHEFARRIAAVEKLKATQRAALAELDALFAALQQRAFRGEL